MEKLKWNYVVYIIIFCSAIAIGSGFYLGTFFGKNKIVEVSTNVNSLQNTEVIDVYKLVAEDTLKNLFNLLNSKTMEDNAEDSCKIFATDYFAEFKYSNTEYDFLSSIAPFVADCLMGYELTIVPGDVEAILMNEIQNKIFNNYFNVNLDSLDSTSYVNIANFKDYIGKDYYLAGIYPDGIGVNSMNYKLEKIVKVDDKYVADVVVTNEETNDVYYGSVVISYKNSHIYYDSFMINVKN